MINIAVTGVNGRMGSTIAQLVLQQPDLKLTLASVRANNTLVGTGLPGSEVVISGEPLAQHKEPIAVLIDFTLPEGVMQHLAYCRKNKIAMVIGSTGLTPQQMQQLEAAAKEIPILYSANMSIGVNICYKLLASAAKMFDSKWDFSIVDIHHKHKKDSPSGTAKQMAHVLASSSGRLPEEINIYSERQGDTVGEHTVTFATEDEIVMIGHVAENRSIFAKGSIIAARWLADRRPGLYSMQDVI